MRIFVALEIPERTKDNLARSAVQFKQFATAGNFVAPQNYHLTLHFLGEVAESDLMYVQNAMDGIKHLPAPTLSLLQFVTLRGSDATVARLKNCPALVELHDLLGEKLENNNFTVEHRAYRPHITLCRKAKLPKTWMCTTHHLLQTRLCCIKVSFPKMAQPTHHFTQSHLTRSD